MTGPGNTSKDYAPVLGATVVDLNLARVPQLDSAAGRSAVPLPGAPLVDARQPGESVTWPAEYGGGK